MRKKYRKIVFIKKEKKRGSSNMPAPIQPEIRELAIYCTMIAKIEAEELKGAKE